MPRYVPPGRLIDIGGHRLHLNATGAGPTVVFDAALGGSSLSWTPVQPGVAEFARTVLYDRAGFGWSDAGPMPRTAGRIANELKVLLDRSEEPPPYVLVGHSFGGLVTSIFATRFPELTRGLVLVDTAHAEDWMNPSGREAERLLRGASLCRYGARASRLGIARAVATLAATGALTPAFAIAKFFSRGQLRNEDQWILSPMQKLPAEVRGPLRQFWTQARFFEALGSQIETMRTSAAETMDAIKNGYGDLPLVTISATNPSDHRMRQQTRIAASSTRGRHVIATNSGHWIPMDEPRTVVDGIKLALSLAEGRRSEVKGQR